MVVGAATLIDSRPPLTRENYMQYRDKHAIPQSSLDEVLQRGWVFPWVLSDVRRMRESVPYRHKGGAVIFVRLEASVSDAIEDQLGDMPAAQASAHSPGAKQSYPGAQSSKDQGRASMTTRSPFGPAVPHTSNETTFVFRPESAQAYGRPLPGGEFLVLAGSTAMRHGSPDVKRDAEDRAWLVRQGILVPDADPRHHRFARDHVFSSASKAAGIVKDGNASGPSLWKDAKTGQSLKDYLGSR